MRTIWVLNRYNTGIGCAYEYRGDAINEARMEYLDFITKRLEEDEDCIKANEIVKALRQLEENGFIECFVQITEITLESDSRYNVSMCCKEAF